MSLRKRLRGTSSSAREAARSPGKTAAVLLSKVAFIALAIWLLLFAMSADALLLALGAALLLGLMVRSVIPESRIKGKFRRLWTGEAGKERYESARRRLK